MGSKTRAPHWDSSNSSDVPQPGALQCVAAADAWQSFSDRLSTVQRYQLESGCSWIIFWLFFFITAKSRHLSLLSGIQPSPFSMGSCWSTFFSFRFHCRHDNTCSWSRWEQCPEQLTYSCVCCSRESRSSCVSQGHSTLTLISQCLNPPPTKRGNIYKAVKTNQCLKQSEIIMMKAKEKARGKKTHLYSELVWKVCSSQGLGLKTGEKKEIKQNIDHLLNEHLTFSRALHSAGEQGIKGV